MFQAKAMAAVGAARFLVTATSGNIASHEQTDVPLLPAGPRTRTVQEIPLEEGTTDLTQYLQGWVPTSERSTFWVTHQPLRRRAGPRGVPAPLPVWLRGADGVVDATLAVRLRPDAHHRPGARRQRPHRGHGHARPRPPVHDADAVGRLQPLAGRAGGLRLGHGERGAHAARRAEARLSRCRRSGSTPPLKYMEEEVENFENGRRSEAQMWTELGHGDPEPYLQYVLAVAGKGRKGRIQKLIDLLPPPERRERRAALHAAGRALRERRSTLRERAQAPRRGRARRLAREPLDAVLGPAPARLHALHASPISSGRTRPASRWRRSWPPGCAGTPTSGTPRRSWSGASPAWASTSAARPRASRRRSSPERGARSPRSRRAPGANGSDRVWSLARASEYKSLDLRIKDKGQGRLFAMISSEGVRQKQDTTEGGSGLEVSRRYVRQDGTAIDFASDKHGLGDLVYAEITLKNGSGDRLDNLALVDRFPSGWEVENPRLGRGGGWRRLGQRRRALETGVREHPRRPPGALRRPRARREPQGGLPLARGHGRPVRPAPGGGERDVRPAHLGAERAADD